MKHFSTNNDMDPNFPNTPGTELREAYEAVERAENFLAETRKLSVSGSYLRDTPASGYWSPQVVRIFGLDRAEEAPPIDVWISMVLRPDFERTVEAAQRAFRERLDYETEFRVRLRDGSVKVLHSHAHPVSARFGYDFALVGGVTDIAVQTQSRTDVSDAGGELRRRIPA